jgi:hypothetical protein
MQGIVNGETGMFRTYAKSSRYKTGKVSVV